MLKRDELVAVTGNLPACYVWSSSWHRVASSSARDDNGDDPASFVN